MAAIRPFARPALARCALVPPLVALSLAFASPAHAAPIHAGLELGMRGLFGAGDFSTLASPSFGSDIALTLVNEAGGLGVRAVGGLHALESRNMDLGPSMYGGITNASFNTSQDLWWFGLGPSWAFAGTHGRRELYVLLGRAKASVTGGAKWAYVDGAAPINGASTMFVVGGEWAPPANGRRYSIVLGGEFMLGANGTFYDEPPAQSNGTGGWTSRTREASIRGAVLRVAFGVHKKKPKS